MKSLFNFFLLPLLASTLHAITITEGGNDFPQFNDAANIASFTYTLEVGVNTISGTATSFSDQQDNFRVVVPVGKRISQVTKTNTATQPSSVGCDFNLETLTGAGTATFPGIQANGGTPYPLGAGEYRARAYADAFSNAWSFTITVVDAPELVAYWDFNALPVNGVVTDRRAGLPAKVLGGAVVGAGGTGKSAGASDRSVHFGTGAQRLNVSGTSEAAYLTSLAAQDKMSVVYWVKQNQRSATAFRFEAPVLLPADTRNFSAHAPWSDSTVYFDTAGCCDSTRRLNVATTGITWTDWHHFAFVKDVTDKRIYRDGSLIASGTGAVTIARAMTELFIGNAPNLAEAVDGDIDDFAVYSGALSTLDVSFLAGGQTPTAVAALPADSDNDGLPDKWEQRFASNLTSLTSATADNDNDGLTNAAELAYGTNPLVANTFVVTTTALTGAGSLPQLLTDAAAAPGPNVITFSPTVFTGATPTTNTITLASELSIADADGVAIDASGIASGVKIDGGAGTNRIFNVAAAGNLTLNSLTLTGGNGGASGPGGAIVSTGQLTIKNCTLAGNSSLDGGGAISCSTAGSALSMESCTISGNTAGWAGGIWANATNVSLLHCTISGNTSGGSGGIVIEGGTGSFTSCLIAGNAATGVGEIDMDLGGAGSTLTLSRGNLIGVTASLYGSQTTPGQPNANGDYIGTGAAPLLPKLGPLANNGGPTQTMLPLPGSPARDRITSSTLTTDQRGVTRRLWGRVDIGAVEASIQADCAWEVREVWRSNIATLIQSHADADAALADPAALEIVSTAAVINFADLGYPAGTGFFPAEQPYASDNRTAQGLVDGNDNDFALLARTFITITTEDDYTFGFSSNDGARLRLFSGTGGGAPNFTSSTRLNTANPADPAHSGNTLTFDAQTGNADTLGVVHLTPGTYGVEFLSWERALGAQCEVFVARGARTVVDGNFRLLGDVSNTNVTSVGTLSAAAWTVTEIHNGANTYATAIDQVTRSWCGEAIPGTTTTNNVPTLNYYDPQNGGGGHGLTQTAFPGNTAADDNNFALGARATITIPVSGDYTFNVLGDDGVRLRILGSRGWTVSGGAGATAMIDGFSAPTCCADAFGQVKLAGGTYQIELIYNEIGGGAYVGLWAAPGRLTAYDPVRFSLVGGTPSTVAAPIAFPRMTGLTRPVNDDFADALRLTGLSTHAASCNTGATIQAGEPTVIPNFSGLRGSSLWWIWTAPSSTVVQVDTIGSSFDTELAVLTGTSVGNLTEVAYNSDSGGANFTSRLTFAAVAGTVYRIQVSGFGIAQGNIRLNLGPPLATPANDAFVNFIALPGFKTTTFSGTNAGATKQPGEPSHGNDNGGSSVWFTWTPAASGSYIVDTRGSDFDTQLAVYTGSSVDTLTLLVKNDSGAVSDNTSLVVLNATAGLTYRIAVDGFNGNAGNYWLSIAPGLSDLPDTSVTENVVPAAIPFVVGDTARQDIVPTITATSSNTALLPNASLVIAGTGCTNRTLQLPALPMAATGTVVTISTNVDGTNVSDSFTITVLPSHIVTNNTDGAAGSLRACVAAMASASGPNTIGFASGLGNIVLTSGEIVLNDTAAITIDASNLPAGITISGNNTSRIFRVTSGTTATLKRVTMINGNGAGGGTPATYGGAIHTTGNLTLSECTISNNSTNVGAAIFNQTPGVLTIDRSTLSGNTSTNVGGAIQNESTLVATYSTFGNNTAANEAGAISAPFAKPVTLKHCTVSGNTVTSGTGNSGGLRGTALSIENSIISNNTATTDPNLTSGFTSTGVNIIAGSPLLAPLDNYGGPTKTFALLPASPARNASTVIAPAPSMDQRVYPIINTPDIGAYEAGNLTQNYNAWIWETLPATATTPQHATTFDFDNDGQTNLTEFIYQTNPNGFNQAIQATVTTVAPNIVISIPTAPGRNYRLRQSDNLTTWIDAPNQAVKTGNGTTQTFTVPLSVARRFYQVQVE